MKNFTAIILAAGKGTRLNLIKKNKVVKKIAGKPMINYTIDHLKKAGIDKIIVVVGFQKSSVIETLGSSCTYAVQKNPIGTGNAVASALPDLSDTCQHVLVLNGDDSAFYSKADLSSLISTHLRTKADLTLLTVKKENPDQLGRIIRDKKNKVKAIVEFRNANPNQKKLKEVNTATYCFNRQFLEKFIKHIKKNPVSNEFYLTDMLEIAVKNHKKVSAVKLSDPNHFHGVNTMKDLESANQKMITKTK